jgi:NADH dehydrogenase (ubiquinone) flavoprotein 2
MIEAGQPLGVEQPKSFTFTPENLAEAQKHIAKYPAGAFSAIMPLLHIAQKQAGWLPSAAIVACADLLSMPHIRAFEVASFYTMYNRRPVGKHHVQVCTSGPCHIMGGDELLSACRNKLGVHGHEVTADGKFSIVEVECLGACVNAPMVQINDDYYEDLSPESLSKLLDNLADGKPVKTGSQTGRTNSCAASGATTLKERA